MNYRMIAYSVGRILVAVAATMLAPLGLSLFYGESIALAYVIPIVISILIGLGVSAKAPKNKSLYGRDGMFIVAIGILLYSQKDKDGFDMIWRYFAWSNQTLAVFTLWALTVYLVQAKKLYVITLIPALFMTAVCSTYIFVAPEGFGLSSGFSQLLGLLVTLNVFGIFLVWKRKKV